MPAIPLRRPFRLPDVAQLVGLVALSAVIGSAFSVCHSAQPTSVYSIDQWIEDLAADSYVSRQLAQRRLVAGAARSVEDRNQVLDRLRRAQQRRDAPEIRLASGELIAEIEHQRRQTELSRLTDPRVALRSIALTRIGSLLRWAGPDDRGLRSTIANIADRDPDWLAGRPDRPRHRWHLRDSSRRTDRLPTGDDALTWLTRLIDDLDGGVGHGAARLGTALCVRPGGIRPGESDIDRVLSRVLDRWLTHRGPTLRHDIPYRIAARYERFSAVRSLARTRVSERSGPPTNRTAALLLLQVDPEAVPDWRSLLSDSTWVCTWQPECQRRIRIRTQVRDVALAVGWWRAGVDPRTKGFEYLVADQDLIFRVESLGFADATARDRAFGAMAALERHGSIDLAPTTSDR